ncbi:bifunctional phosphatase PAP2/diacylglycerol kinase family protein [Skermania piniformis]
MGVVSQVHALDVALFQAIAQTESPALDRVMPLLTNAADYSKLWVGIALAMQNSGSRRTRRAATRGLITLGITSFAANQVTKRMSNRKRPELLPVPLARRSKRLPSSSSFPSGHAATAAAFAAAVGLESPAIGFALSALAGAVGFSRIATGAHYPSDVIAGFALGAGIATLGGRLVPPVEPIPPNRSEPMPIPQPPRPRGQGVVLVINPRSGGGRGTRILAEVRVALPDAEIIELAPDADLVAVLDAAAQRAQVLGVGGGDGTVGAAAQAAMRHDIPLAVFPAGTFNHFAGDLGLGSVAQVVRALADGNAGRVDVAYLNDQPFLNTASAGAYPEFVRIRERYERRIGKFPAAAVAAFLIARTAPTSRVRYDDKEIELQGMFVGNSVYEPRGFAPAIRTRMDDGLVDVRLLEAASGLRGIGFLFAVATGRIAHNRRYHELDVPRFEMDILDGAVPVARDGELGEITDRIEIRVDYRALTVYRPPGFAD